MFDVQNKRTARGPIRHSIPLLPHVGHGLHCPALRQSLAIGHEQPAKIYLAFGIRGLKGNLFVAAVKNPKPPIFQMTDIGVVADIP
jgi:hypothetical protein